MAKRNRMQNDRFYVNGVELEMVTEFSYFRMIDFRMMGPTPTTHNSMILKTDRAQATLYSMIREGPPQLAMKLYKQLIMPISTYGGEIWGPYELTRTRLQEDSILHETTTKKFMCETLQTKFIKRVLGVKKRAIKCAARGEIGCSSSARKNGKIC